MRTSLRGLLFFVLIAAPAVAEVVPVAGSKLLVIDKGATGKTVFIAKGAAVTKGASTDVDAISARLDVLYAGTAGAFIIPSGGYDGTAGWKANKTSVAKYKNGNAPAGATGAKVALVKPGKMVKLVAKSAGDVPIGILGDDEVTGSVFTAYTVINGSDVNVHCSEFPASSCKLKSIAGGTGTKLLCKGGVADPTCAALGEPTSMQFGTYNVGLAQNFVPLTPERLPEVAQAISETNYDVLCLEEVFQDAHVTAISAAVSEAYPYSYYELTDDPSAGGDPACTEDDVDDLLTCVTANNCDTAPEGLVTCAVANCNPEIAALSSSNPTCFTCIAANSGLPLDLLQQVCLEGGGTLRDGGRNGVMLLSKHPLIDPEFISFDAFLVKRVALHARIFEQRTGFVDLFCTHLTADLSGVAPYNGTFDSYEEEHAAEVAGLVDWIDEVGTSGHVVAMGDFNTGPAVPPDIVGELPANFAGFVDGGLVSPYLSSPGICTYCSDNTLNTPSTNDVLIDHVFFRGMPGGAGFSAARVFEELVSVDPGDGPVMTNLSDHYGVVVTMTLP